MQYGAAHDGPATRPRHRAGRFSRAVTADRGYGQAAVDRDLGVQTVAIPARPRARARLTQAGQMTTRMPRPHQLSQRDQGWDRALLDGKNGAST